MRSCDFCGEFLSDNDGKVLFMELHEMNHKEHKVMAKVDLCYHCKEKLVDEIKKKAGIEE